MYQIRALLIIVLVTLLAGCAGHSHYAGWQNRDIKALSESDVVGYRAGRGMSLALAAELNGYPGPLHVLEMAKPLELTQDQQNATQVLYQRMQSSAIAAGEVLIEAERRLDQLFATRKANPEELSALLISIGNAQARLRAVHMQAHLEQVKILRPEQVAKYNKLRGYSN